MLPPESREPRGQAGLVTATQPFVASYADARDLQALREVQWRKEASRLAAECRRGDARACDAFRRHRAAMGGKLRALRKAGAR